MLDLLDADRLLLRRTAIQHGYDDNALARHVKAGRLIRIRQGAYAETGAWTAASRAEQQRLSTLAVMQQYRPDSVAVSHSSAVILLGGPSWRLDLDNVHLTSLYGRHGRREAGVVHHRGALRVGDTTRHGGLWVTSPARTVLDLASTHPIEPAVAVADWAIREGLVAKGELEWFYGCRDDWPHTLSTRRVLGLADGRSDSVAESWAKVLFRQQGLPPADQQYDVYDANHVFVGRVDFAWPALGVIVEIDGKEKYHRYRRDGESVEEMVVREKIREDRLRETTGWIVVRLVWTDLLHPAHTAARIRQAMVRAA